MGMEKKNPTSNTEPSDGASEGRLFMCRGLVEWTRLTKEEHNSLKPLVALSKSSLNTVRGTTVTTEPKRAISQN